MNNSQSSAIVSTAESIKVKDTEYFLKKDYDIKLCKEIIIVSEENGMEKFRIEINRYLRALNGIQLTEFIKRYIENQLFDK